MVGVQSKRGTMRWPDLSVSAPSRDEERAEWGEIYAIYVLEPYWGKGLGYQLYKRCVC